MKFELNVTRDTDNSYPDTVTLTLEPLDEEVEISVTDPDRRVRVSREEFIAAALTIWRGAHPPSIPNT